MEFVTVGAEQRWLWSDLIILTIKWQNSGGVRAEEWGRKSQVGRVRWMSQGGRVRRNCQAEESGGRVMAEEDLGWNDVDEPWIILNWKFIPFLSVLFEQLNRAFIFRFRSIASQGIKPKSNWRRPIALTSVEIGHIYRVSTAIQAVFQSLTIFDLYEKRWG